MPSISHRTSLGQGTPHRAEPGSAALPTGCIRECIGGIVGWLVQWCEDWRALRRLGVLDDHLLRDIGLTEADAQRSTIAPAHRDRHSHDPKGMPTWPTIF